MPKKESRGWKVPKEKVPKKESPQKGRCLKRKVPKVVSTGRANHFCPNPAPKLTCCPSSSLAQPTETNPTLKLKKNPKTGPQVDNARPSSAKVPRAGPQVNTPNTASQVKRTCDRLSGSLTGPQVTSPILTLKQQSPQHQPQSLLTKHPSTSTHCPPSLLSDSRHICPQLL